MSNKVTEMEPETPKVKSSHWNCPALVFVLTTIAFIIYLLLLLRSEETGEHQGVQTLNQSIDNGCSSFLIGDSICDEVTNIERCEFDGGDCCLSKESKSMPTCQVCTCKMKINQTLLQADLENFDVRAFTCITDYDDNVILSQVVEFMDVAMQDACSTLCLDASRSRTTTVNGWSYDSTAQHCSCSFLEPTLCLQVRDDDQKLVKVFEKETHAAGKTGFVMMSETLKCGMII